MIRQKIAKKIVQAASRWLLKNEPPKRRHLCDFPQICEKVLPGDVLLVEGRSRASQIIKLMTQSPWSHAMLYIGRPADIWDTKRRLHIQKSLSVASDTQLLIESELGYGTIVSVLEKYQDDHIRILRPQGLSAEDTQKVITYAMGRIGADYDIRHIIDLGRFLLPWSLFPSKWRNYLFEQGASKPTEDICSSMIAQAFQSIHFPILPVFTRDEAQNLELIERNARFFTPSDFDFSPYFSIIKYPIFPVDQHEYYHDLPWKEAADTEETKNLPKIVD